MQRAELQTAGSAHLQRRHRHVSQQLGCVEACCRRRAAAAAEQLAPQGLKLGRVQDNEQEGAGGLMLGGATCLRLPQV